MSEIISVINLKKSYGQTQIIKNLSFSVNKGEVFGLLGQNGAGKSTVIDCILGMKKFEEGQVAIFGKTHKKRDKALFESVGVQFQQSHYQKKIKVYELCELTSSYYKKTVDWRNLICAFGLQGKEKSYVEKLSGGEKQKLSVLLTLIADPQIVFLDELTTGLDTLARRKVWSQLVLLKEKGRTIFLTSHYMDEVEILCDRIGIIMEGEMAFIGTVQEAMESSGKSSLEEAYLWFTGEEDYEGI